MHLNTFLAQATTTASAPATATTATTAATDATKPAPTGMQALLNSPLPMLVLFGVVFYFILIRPQSQQRKKQAALLAALKSGDKIVTTSGIVGIVVSVKDNSVTMRSADSKMEVTKASVTQILEGTAATEA